MRGWCRCLMGGSWSWWSLGRRRLIWETGGTTPSTEEVTTDWQIHNKWSPNLVDHHHVVSKTGKNMVSRYDLGLKYYPPDRLRAFTASPSPTGHLLSLLRQVYWFSLQVTMTTTSWFAGSGRQWRDSTTSRDSDCCKWVMKEKHKLTQSVCLPWGWNGSVVSVCDRDVQYPVRGLRLSQGQQRAASLLCGEMGQNHVSAQVIWTHLKILCRKLLHVCQNSLLLNLYICLNRHCNAFLGLMPTTFKWYIIFLYKYIEQYTYK